MIDSQSSSPNSINSGVSQSSVPSSTLFLLFINDLLNLTWYPIHLYADDSALRSTSFSRRPNQIQVNDSSRDATERLTSELSLVSDWGKENIVLFIASKTQFLHLSIRQNLPDNYPLYSDDTHLSPSTLNILGLCFTKNLNCKSYISSLAKPASKKFVVLCLLHQFYKPYQLLTLYRGLILPCMEFASHIWGGSKHTVAN